MMTDDLYDSMMVGFRIFVLILLVLCVGVGAYLLGHKATTTILKPAAEALVATNTIESTVSVLALQGQIQELKDENEYLSSQIQAYKDLAAVADKNAAEAMANSEKLANKPPEKIYIYVPQTTTVTVPPWKKP
jgi:demethoxyubiquinone hydroxylase (CLK1/Coq7/Cat5 family)